MRSVAFGTWVFALGLLAGCGGGGAVSTVCDAYLDCLQTFSSANGQTASYDSARQQYGPSGACGQSSQARAACDSACSQALSALSSAGASCASAPASSDGACVTGALCSNSAKDCNKGERCNATLSPPTCQKLYCGVPGSTCGGDDAAGLCSTHLCEFGLCTAPNTPLSPQQACQKAIGFTQLATNTCAACARACFTAQRTDCTNAELDCLVSYSIAKLCISADTCGVSTVCKNWIDAVTICTVQTCEASCS